VKLGSLSVDNLTVRNLRAERISVSDSLELPERQ
jgi:hypothetical protein